MQVRPNWPKTGIQAVKFASYAVVKSTGDWSGWISSIVASYMTFDAESDDAFVSGPTAWR